MKSPITTFNALMTAAVLAAAALSMLASCKEKPRSIGEKIDDAMNTRPHEKLKDAAEDVKDAAHDAKEAVKDATK